MSLPYLTCCLLVDCISPILVLVSHILHARRKLLVLYPQDLPTPLHLHRHHHHLHPLVTPPPHPHLQGRLNHHSMGNEGDKIKQREYSQSIY